MSTEALHGGLQHFFPAEVLQLLMLAQATGRLELERSGEHADVFVERGRPVFARTTGGSVRAGEVLVHRGAIAAPALDAALAEQASRPGVRLGTLLVERGLVTPEQLQAAVTETLRRIVYGVLLWREGTFRFVPGDRPPDDDIRIDLDLDRLILEGLRLADQARPS